jgi:signal transduction histidine kinase
VLAERARVARELHDGLLQDAMTIALQLRAVLPEVRAVSEAAARDLTSVLELAERTTTEARRAIFGLRPASTETVATAVERAVRRATAFVAPKLSLAVGGRVRHVDPVTQTTVVRIAQEAATNAVRHARATRLWVSIAFGPQRLRVTIRDDGRGFDPHGAPGPADGHFGLIGMRERACVAHGWLEIHSRPGVGTAIVLEVPLSPPQGGSRICDRKAWYRGS